MNFLKYPIKIINNTSSSLGYFASTFYLFIVFFTTYEVFMRYVLDKPTNWVFETCVYLSGAAICMAGPFVTKEQTHISITTILDQLPIKIRKIIKTFNLLFACIVCFVLIVINSHKIFHIYNWYHIHLFSIFNEINNKY